VGWLAATLRAAAEQADALSDALIRCGARSVAIEDAAEAGEGGLYTDPEAQAQPLWQHCLLVATFEAETDVSEAILAAAAQAGITPPDYELRRIDDQDWIRLSQSQFTPIQIASGMWIVPSWCDPPDPGAIVIRLDPGQAFGTGAHPTTKLCLRWMAENIAGGESVLDYGCGSGILAIAAAKLGAAAVSGFDIDPVAVTTARDNATRNGVQASFLIPGTKLPWAAWDISLANILARPLQMLAPLLARATRGGGSLVLAGIRAPEAPVVMAAYQPWFEMGVHAEEEGWLCLTGVKRRRPPRT
jgi:ribosomal protein L11 methyltransferase